MMRARMRLGGLSGVVILLCTLNSAYAGSRYTNEDIVEWDEKHPGLMLAMSTVLIVRGTVEECLIVHAHNYERLVPAIERVRRWDRALAEKFNDDLGEFTLLQLRTRTMKLIAKKSASGELSEAHCLHFAEGVANKQPAPELRAFLAD